MAIGIRITSENLSGETVNVSFQPFTGGTPIDLGVQSIPFNYYNTSPYGEYTISSTTYNYTYSLTVTEPYGENQNYAFMGNVSGETNFSLAFMNFNDFSAQIIDLGVDSNYWDEYDWYPMSESGYISLFVNWGDNAKLVLFINKDGEIVDQYSGITTSWNVDTLDGRITSFVDNTNGIMKYFNGESVYEYTFDPNTESLDIQWDRDATTLDKTFIFVIQNTSNTTKTSYRALNNGSIVFIDSWDYTIESRYYGTYYSSKYFYEFSYLSSGNSVTTIKIYDSLGNVVYNPSITPELYKNWNITVYGVQSFSFLLYDDSTPDTDYLILDFNGVTQNDTQTTHVRGTNYTNSSTYYDTNFWPNDTESGSLFYLFYGNSNNYYPGGGYEYAYMDIVYRLKDDTTYTTYTFTDTGDFTKTFYPWSSGNKSYYTFCTTGDGISSVFSVTESGVKITQTGKNINDINDTNLWSFGDYFVYLIYTNSYNTGDFYLFLNGDLIQTLNLDLSQGFNWNSSYETLFMRVGDNGYYVNNNVTGFTATSGYTNTYNSNNYYVENYYQTNGIILLFNQDNNFARVLSRNNITNEFSLPTYNSGWDIRVGRDKFLYVYNDNSNNTRINLYDFNGALLNSILVTINGWDNIYAVKDRYVVKHTDINGDYLLTMVSSDDFKQITLSNDFSNWDNINDYIWWD